MGNNKFDEIDRRILDILQQDSDIPVAEIAERVNLSQTPVWRRIKGMEAAGLIRARVTLVDHKQMGVPMTLFIGVKTMSHAKNWLEQFGAFIEETPEVVEAYRLTGETDYIMKVVVPDIAAYDLVYKRMTERLEFSSVVSSIAMEELKFTTAVPTQYL